MQPLQSNASRIIYLDYCRAIAIFCVVLNHVIEEVFGEFGFTLGANYYLLATTLNGSYPFFHAAVFYISRLGVPLFLMISGVLLLNKEFGSREKIKRFYIHNLLQLLITAELWYAIMYFILATLDPSAGETTDLYSFFKGLFFNSIFVNQKTFVNMWYVPMILMVYSLIPIAGIIRKNIANISPAVILPLVLTLAITFVVPDVFRTISAFTDYPDNTLALSQNHLFSRFWIYIVLGCWIGNGGMKKLNSTVLIIADLLSLSIGIYYQMIIYASPAPFSIGYECSFILLTAVLIFETLRRFKYNKSYLKAIATHISRSAFAIFLMHIIILKLIIWYYPLPTINRPALTITLTVSIYIICIAIISIFSLIPPIRKHLFYIK